MNRFRGENMLQLEVICVFNDGFVLSELVLIFILPNQTANTLPRASSN